MRHCLSALAEIDPILRAAKRILIACDFDGTLCPIAATPSEVHLPRATLEVLQFAAECPKLTLAVISGRALSDVKSKVPLDILFAGNHGLEISGGGLSFEHTGARAFRPTLEAACKALTDAVQPWPDAWIENKGLSATLHFRKVDQRHHSPMLLSARRALATFGPWIGLRMGKRALEVRPKVYWDKGRAIHYILDRSEHFDCCVCIGDDRTDETMFRANRGGLNIRVGCESKSAAAFCVQGPDEVAIFLSHVTEVCNSESSAEWGRLASSLSA